MKACCVALLSFALAGLGAEPAPAVLRWLSGETLPGEWQEASRQELTWKTPLFEEPLALRWDGLRRIDRPLQAAKIADPFSIVLRDGSHLYGDLRAVNDDTVTIQSTRHGEVALQRAAVLSVRRLRGGGLLAGPTGDVGWDVLANRQQPAGATSRYVSLPVANGVTTGPAGSLQLPYWNGGAFCDLALPEVVEVEFRVRSSKRPDFVLALEADSKQRLRVETWGGELVLVCADQYKAIRRLTDDERTVALRVCWDRKARKCAVFTPAGEPIAEWAVPEETAKTGSSLVLQNKGRDLTLEFVRVRAWDGKAPPKTELTRPRVELADGRVVAGGVAALAEGTVTLRAHESTPAASFPLNEVDALFFSADPPTVAERPAALSYADGTVLFGRIESLKDSRLALATSFCATPLPTNLDGLRQCLFRASPADAPAPELPLADLDQLVIQQTTLRGRLVMTGGSEPRWLPAGGTRPVTPAKAAASEIQRTIPPQAEPAKEPVLFYINSGDVLSGNLRGLDRAKVEIESGLVAVRELRADELDALQFASAARASLQGFHDAGWLVLKGGNDGVRREGDSLKMQPGAVFGHPAAMESSELQFSIANTSSPTVRLRLFCAGTEGARSMNLLIAHWGSRVYFGTESTPGQLDSQQQVRITSGRALAVRLVVQEKQLELHLNGALTETFPIDPAKRAGMGLILEPAGLWGNVVREVTLSGFSTRSLPGSVGLPEVSAETKTQALTVPRFRKNDLPRHAIIAANGDVLRGEIEAATATHFGFRSGLENLRVPRDRVRAAIWLKKPAAASAAGATRAASPSLLEKKTTQRTRYSSATLSSLTAFLQRAVPELKFKLPEPADNRRVSMQFNGQTIAVALDQICGLFGLSYRLDAGNTVVFEPAVPTSTSLVQKVYWLKADAFPQGSSAQKVLAGKALEFPKGAIATWEPAARQLSMINTAENHAKLAALLDAEFGGSLGSPTHWLLLTNGARLGLVAEKFDLDTVVGSHPVYGRCTVPVAQIHRIRTSPPPPTPAIRAVEGWRLVFAPEPVLPETGGQSSPLLGKAAQSFKLPLLDGGEFELSKRKGKVVVLDFWATWCGPCIKAVPELIAALAAFPGESVELIGVNQSEPPEQVKRFLTTRGWKLAVALDAGQNVARQFGVDGIPHTVVIGPEGKVAWVKTGYSPEGAAEAAKAVQQLLPAPAAVQ